MKHLLVAGLLLAISVTSGCAGLFGGCGPHGAGITLEAAADGNLTAATLDRAELVLQANGYGNMSRTGLFPGIVATKDHFMFRALSNDVASEPRFSVTLDRRAEVVEFSGMDAARNYGFSFEPEARQEFEAIWTALAPTGWRLREVPMAEPRILLC